MREKLIPEAGKEYQVRYPFLYDPTPSGYDQDGAPYDEGRWHPGIRPVQDGPEEVTMEADGVGVQILTVVSIHKPGKYQTRVFYTQSWIDPDGRKFGKNACRVMTLEKFRRRSAGFQLPFDHPASQQTAAE